MLKRIVKMRFRAGSEDAFLEIFEASKKKIRAFPGCHHLELLRDSRDLQTFFTISIWADEDALEAYRHSELFSETWAATRALFAEKARAWSTQSLELLV